MTDAEKVFIGLALVMLIGVLTMRHSMAPSADNTEGLLTTPGDDVSGVVGNSNVLANPVGVAYLTANQGWLFPPPLQMALPISATDDASSKNTGGCPGCG